jgi:hypothetical protein
VVWAAAAAAAVHIEPVHLEAAAAAAVHIAPVHLEASPKLRAAGAAQKERHLCLGRHMLEI